MRLSGIGAGAITGAVIGLLALDPGFIAGTGGKWIRPDNDLASYIVALEYYLHDGWRFPLFDLPQMGYPEGGSVLLNDALPLTALGAKVLQKVFGLHINPFGAWVLLTYVLQGAMAARLLCSFGACSTWVAITAAVFAVANTAFLSRIIHTALSSHFLILWALAVYFESLRAGRVRRTESLVLLVVTLLVNPYLFVMVVALEIATVGTLAVRRQLTWRDAILSSMGVVGVAAVGIASGYFTRAEGDRLSGWGYGFYSWNPVGLLWPPTGLFGFGAHVFRDATGGQYEGEAYVGAGALLMLALAVLYGRRNILRDLRAHWLLSLLLFAFAVFALSNRIHLAGRLLLTVDLPPLAMYAAGLFRATGRFIWPLSYCLTLLPMAYVFHRWRRQSATIACVVAAALQLGEAAPQIRAVRHATANPAPDLINQVQMTGWIAAHDRLWQYPSYPCGGLNQAMGLWGGPEFNREFQTEWLAAKAGIPTNSIYSSRRNKDCVAEGMWATTPRFEDGVLYILGRGVVTASPELTEMAESGSCVTLDWAVVCSASWSTTETENLH